MQTQCKHLPDDTTQNARGERASRRVLTLTAAMTVVEVTAGMAYGSMSLLADGWHMATHAAALGITAFASDLRAAMLPTSVIRSVREKSASSRVLRALSLSWLLQPCLLLNAS